ncbi:MAG: hypothetical protein AB7G21_14240 [Dehalococcoidia bacterium]
MTDDMKLTVDGLRAFRRELRGIGPEFPKALQQENKKFAQEVASSARDAYTALYKSRSGRGAASIRGLATQTSAQVAMGTARTPYMLGQEFGAGAADIGQGEYTRISRTLFAKSVGGRALFGKGKRFTRSSMRQFPAYITADSGRGGRGYFLYPTLRREVPKLIERYGKAIEVVTRRAFGTPEVTFRG